MDISRKAFQLLICLFPFFCTANAKFRQLPSMDEINYIKAHYGIDIRHYNSHESSIYGSKYDFFKPFQFKSIHKNSIYVNY